MQLSPGRHGTDAVAADEVDKPAELAGPYLRDHLNCHFLLTATSGGVLTPSLALYLSPNAAAWPLDTQL
jgi:hypothetical protein